MEVSYTAFVIGFFSSTFLVVLIATSVYSANFRFWPPGSRNWKWLTYWTLSTANMVSITLLLLPEFATLFTLNGFFSVLLILSGLIISFIAIKQLGLEKTSGIEGEFSNEGLYRYSRNPQVLGNLVTLFGAALLLQTVEGVLVCFLTGLWLITMVFAEEQWLQQIYDEKYAEYRQRTPRFF